MFFTENILKTLLFGILLSLAGNDYTSETPDVAVVSTTAGNSGVLGDLIEGPETQCSASEKRFVTGSFDFGQNCPHFINETSLQCFPNLEKVQPFVVLYNASEYSEDEKYFNLILSKNGWQFRSETSTTHENSRFSFLKGRIAITENIKYLLELDTVQKAFLLLVFLLCFIWKYRTFLLSRLKTITKVHSKCTVPCTALVKKIKLSNSEKDTEISRTASEKSSFAENDAKLPERSSVNHGKTASFLNDVTISSAESDSKSGDSSDNEFPDELFLVGSKNRCIKHMLIAEDWEPINLARYDSSSESHDVEKNGSSNLLQTKDWKVDLLVNDGIKPVTSSNNQHKISNGVQMNDLALTSSSSEEQGTSSHTFENNTTNLLELRDLNGDGDNCVAPLGDQDDKITGNGHSLPDNLMGNIVDDKCNNPDKMISSTTIETGEWSLDNLSDEEIIANCPNLMTDDADKAMVMKDFRFDDYIDSDENCESDEEEFPDEFFLFANPDDKAKRFISTKDLYPNNIVGYDEDEEEFPDEFFLFANPDDKTKSFISTKDLNPNDIVGCDEDEEEFPDEFFLFANSDDKTKSFISTKDLYPNDIVRYDEDEEEFPDEFFLFANPDDETKSFIATKDLYPEDLVSYDDVTNSQNADVMLLGDQSDVVTESSENLGCDEDVDNTEDHGQDVPGKEMDTYNCPTLILVFLSVAFVLPCLILRSS